MLPQVLALFSTTAMAMPADVESSLPPAPAYVEAYRYRCAQALTPKRRMVLPAFPMRLPELPETALLRVDAVIGPGRRGAVNGTARPIFDPNLDSAWGETLDLRHGRDMLASSDLFVRNHAMRFDVLVAPPFRQAGIYAYLLRLALARHPTVTALPARMPIDESESAEAFVVDGFGSKEAFRTFDPLAVSSEALANARKRWLDALRDTPALRVRRKVGFAALQSLFVDPARGFIAFQVSKGAPIDDHAIRVGVAHGAIWDVAAAGTLRPSDSGAYRLVDYVDDVAL